MAKKVWLCKNCGYGEKAADTAFVGSWKPCPKCKKDMQCENDN